MMVEDKDAENEVETTKDAVSYRASNYLHKHNSQGLEYLLANLDHRL